MNDFWETLEVNTEISSHGVVSVSDGVVGVSVTQSVKVVGSCSRTTPVLDTGVTCCDGKSVTSHMPVQTHRAI